MKEKKLKKIADYVADKIMKATTPKMAYEEELVLDCSEETFIKFEKLVNHLLNYDVRIEVSKEYLSLFSNSYKEVKKSKPVNGASQKLHSEDEVIEISISKDYFSMNVGYQKRSKFKKEGVYEHFYEKFIKTLETKNNNNFIDAYHLVMKESGLLRDENLENLFNEDEKA